MRSLTIAREIPRSSTRSGITGRLAGEVAASVNAPAVVISAYIILKPALPPIHRWLTFPGRCAHNDIFTPS